MERDAAKLLLIEAFRAMHISDMLPFLKEVCSPDEYQRFRRGIAKVAATISDEIVEPVFTLHPDLEQELEERVERTGRAY